MKTYLFIHWAYVSDWFRRLYADSQHCANEFERNIKNAWGQ